MMIWPTSIDEGADMGISVTSDGGANDPVRDPAITPAWPMLTYVSSTVSAEPSNAVSVVLAETSSTYVSASPRLSVVVTASRVNAAEAMDMIVGAVWTTGAGDAGGSGLGCLGWEGCSGLGGSSCD